MTTTEVGRSSTHAESLARGEYLARTDVVAYIRCVLVSGGRVILAPTAPYFAVIPSWRMGPTVCVRWGERPVRVPRGRRGRWRRPARSAGIVAGIE